MVLNFLVRTAVAKGGVESVVESMFSVVETDTPSSRGILKQERLEDERFVALYGMLVTVIVTLWSGFLWPSGQGDCDPLVREALSLYSSQYKMEGNKDLIRRSEKIKNYIISEAVDTLVKKPIKFPWIVEK